MIDIRISEIPISTWKVKKASLYESLEKESEISSPRISRCLNSSKNEDYLDINGYALPLSFNCKTNNLITWCRSRPGSGSPVNINDLVVIQEIIRDWYDKEILEYLQLEEGESI